MRRIDKKRMKIEHWYPEEHLTDIECLNYQNMLGVCLGHINGTKGSDDTCDTHKGSEFIKINPPRCGILTTVPPQALYFPKIRISKKISM